MRLSKCGSRFRFVLLLALIVAAALPAAAFADGGGLSPISSMEAETGTPATPTSPTPEATECTEEAGGLTGLTCTPVTTARLILGVAAPPTTAPAAVRAAVAAANQIHTKPYVWGGGHGQWWDEGYDCSGAVSYALHGAGLITVPMDSGEMMGWGEPGKGRWITIFANAGHAFAVIDGLRWDTVGDASGTGPRWHRSMVSTAGFVARHPAGY